MFWRITMENKFTTLTMVNDIVTVQGDISMWRGNLSITEPVLTKTINNKTVVINPRYIVKAEEYERTY